MLSIYKSQINGDFTYPNLQHDLKIIYEDQQESIQIRTMSLPELVEIRNTWLVAQEGWPGIKFTLAATYANDPTGFYLLEKDGQKIASISAVTYPEINFAYIGFYVVIKPFRGQGYGKLIITEAIEYAVTKLGIKAFGLNCIESAVPMYQQYAFQIATVDEFWRYTATNDERTATHNNQLPDELSMLDHNLFTTLVEFDASILGAHRKDFLHNFLTKPNTITIISQQNGKIDGYGVISERDPAVLEAHRSYKLGPLYANNPTSASAILEQLIAIAQPNESIYLETPGNNLAAAAILTPFGFEKIGIQPKMFKGTPPNFDINKMFCYNSIAIGG